MTTYHDLTWRKSSYSQGMDNCVEMASRKSSHSQEGQNNCAETSIGTAVVYLRDSKLGDASPILTFTPSEWAAFLAGAKNGEFDCIPGLVEALGSGKDHGHGGGDEVPRGVDAARGGDAPTGTETQISPDRLLKPPECDHRQNPGDRFWPHPPPGSDPP